LAVRSSMSSRGVTVPWSSTKMTDIPALKQASGRPTLVSLVMSSCDSHVSRRLPACTLQHRLQWYAPSHVGAAARPSHLRT
jgi:hypothetical protein